jgi:hypothetical protein
VRRGDAKPPGRRSHVIEHHVEHQGPLPEPCVLNPTELLWFPGTDHGYLISFLGWSNGYDDEPIRP